MQGIFWFANDTSWALCQLDVQLPLFSDSAGGDSILAEEPCGTEVVERSLTALLRSQHYSATFTSHQHALTEHCKRVKNTSPRTERLPYVPSILSYCI